MLAITTMWTDNEPYRSGAEQLRGQAEALGLGFFGVRIDPPPGCRSVRMWVCKQKAVVCLKALAMHDEILWIDADDELLARPGDMPPDCEIGLWRNPELDLFPTHLQWACSIYARRTQAAANFLQAWDNASSWTGDHRALHVAYAVAYRCFDNPQPIHDVTRQMAGCVRMNPSPLGYRSRAVVSGDGKQEGMA